MEENDELARLDDPRKAEERCYVYIVATTTGAYKIGVANNPENRHASLRPGIPDPSEILLTIRCKNRIHAFAVERGIHQQLDQYRSSGEWFRPPKEVLAELILELGSRIDALTSDYPILEYPIKVRDTKDSEFYHIKPELRLRSRSQIDDCRAKQVMDIIRELQSVIGSSVSIETIIDRAEEMGIAAEKTNEIVKKMIYDGDAWEPYHGMVRVRSEALNV